MDGYTGTGDEVMRKWRMFSLLTCRNRRTHHYLEGYLEGRSSIGVASPKASRGEADGCH